MELQLTQGLATQISQQMSHQQQPQQQWAPPPPTNPPMSAPPAPDPTPARAPSPITPPPTPLSGPIANDRSPEWRVIADYWHWKMAHAPEAQRIVLERAKGIIDAQLWDMEDLKKMEDSSGSAYRRATELGVPDGLAKRFKKDFHDFKKVYRREYEAARVMNAIQHGGGFILNDQGGFIPPR